MRFLSLSVFIIVSFFVFFRFAPVMRRVSFLQIKCHSATTDKMSGLTGLVFDGNGKTLRDLLCYKIINKYKRKDE